MDENLTLRAQKCKKALDEMRRALEGSENVRINFQPIHSLTVDIIEGYTEGKDVAGLCTSLKNELQQYVDSEENLKMKRFGREFATNAQKVARADYLDFMLALRGEFTMEDFIFWSHAIPDPILGASSDPEPEPAPAPQPTSTPRTVRPQGATTAPRTSAPRTSPQPAPAQSGGSGCSGCFWKLILLAIFGGLIWFGWHKFREWKAEDMYMGADAIVYEEDGVSDSIATLTYGQCVRMYSRDDKWAEVKTSDVHGYVRVENVLSERDFAYVNHFLRHEELRRLIPIKAAHAFAANEITSCLARKDSVSAEKGNVLIKWNVGHYGAMAFIINRKGTGRWCWLFSFNKDGYPYYVSFKKLTSGQLISDIVETKKNGVEVVFTGSKRQKKRGRTVTEESLPAEETTTQAQPAAEKKPKAETSSSSSSSASEPEQKTSGNSSPLGFRLDPVN